MELHVSPALHYDADVLVLGAGPAGFCAAVAAAREGARVLLVEQGGCAGGMATAGLVGPFMTCYDAAGEEMILRGLFAEVVDALVARGGAIHPAQVRQGTPYTSWIELGHDHVTPFDPEILKKLLDDMLTAAGVHILYHTAFAEPILAGTRFAGAVLHSKSGFSAARAEVTVDCTGDADAAFRAGVPCEKGNQAAGITQPATLFFRISHVDSPALERDVAEHRHTFHRENGVNYRSLHWRVTQAREAGDWDLRRTSIGLYKGVREDEWSVNTSRIMDIDATDAESLTRGEVEGRRQAEQIMAFLHKYVPGCADARLMSTGSTLGIRESRHIRGEYRLTLEDILQGRVSQDAILLCSNSVDVHGRFGPESNQYIAVEHGRYYGVPYRCLVPQDVDGLLVAGRSLSAQSEAAGAVRVMPPCMAMGQAAGTAAAMAARDRISPRDVNIPGLQERLRRTGAYL
ncbi:FAD-dependent oxidoreductase [Lawsonibacter faecis]|uniref:FAD-dependent oxidoreductase n=1 Tax=Lawsonibacter faecis TaxID=2763052 RepID=A0A8J6JBB0_9FIRM|nr:FAD-dependent oxidoreductase [Lawsonibacter faecis]MBC5736301.1 FAD-dependent oxidoreductase [Lawsonibacter faecis]